MTNVKDVYKNIRSKGKKLTKNRKSIIEMLIGSHNLMTAPEIQQALDDQNIELNKTSVYRELDFLVKNNILKEVHIQPGITHYESAFHPHHHHITCNSCGDVEEVETQELDKGMDKLREKIKSLGFSLKSHELEFYGTCSNCK